MIVTFMIVVSVLYSAIAFVNGSCFAAYAVETYGRATWLIILTVLLAALLWPLTILALFVGLKLVRTFAGRVETR